MFNGRLLGVDRRHPHPKAFVWEPPGRFWGTVRGSGWVVTGHPSEVAAFEPVAVAFEVDDLGVVDEAIDRGGGHGVVAEDSAQRLNALFELTIMLARSYLDDTSWKNRLAASPWNGMEPTSSMMTSGTRARLRRSSWSLPASWAAPRRSTHCAAAETCRRGDHPRSPKGDPVRQFVTLAS